jgi:hypothetical protein
MQIRQLFDAESSTYSYLLWDEQASEAAIIDPVDNQIERVEPTSGQQPAQTRIC